MYYSPLEQFTILPLLHFHIGSAYFSFTNSTLFLVLSLGAFLNLLHLILVKQKGGSMVPSSWQMIIEGIYTFVQGLILEQIGEKGRPYFPLVFCLFTFLLCCNLIGMIPYTFTVTSHFIVTVSLSTALFIGVTLVGFQTHGLHFLSLLLPKGVPMVLAPFLVVIELISYTSRALSLGLRLGANMLAGHTLVKIIAGFSWEMVYSSGIICQLSIVPFAVVIILTGMEIAIAIIQAYVFSMLICLGL